MEYVLVIYKNGRKKKAIEGFHNLKDARKEAYKWVRLETADEIDILSKSLDQFGVITYVNSSVSRYGTMKGNVWIVCHVLIGKVSAMTHYHLNKDGSLGKRIKW